MNSKFKIQEKREWSRLYISKNLKRKMDMLHEQWSLGISVNCFESSINFSGSHYQVKLWLQMRHNVNVKLAFYHFVNTKLSRYEILSSVCL